MSRVRVVLPTVLATSAGGEKRVETSASTVGEVIEELALRYGDAFRGKVLDSSGKPNRLLNFYVNGKNIVFLDGLETQLADGDEISILPIVAGG